MGKGFKTLVVVLLVAIAVPLWFIAWRQWEEWRAGVAWLEFNDLGREARPLFEKNSDDPKGNELGRKQVKLSERYGREWRRLRLPLHNGVGD